MDDERKEVAMRVVGEKHVLAMWPSYEVQINYVLNL